MKRFAYISIVLILFSANMAFAQVTPPPQGVTNVNYTFSRDGIFSCSKNNSYAQSVGSQVAVQGVYVPVSDAAVTLNTGILVYKECILREVINRQKEAATAGIVRQIQVDYTSGRNGQARFLQDYRAETMTERDNAWLRNLQGNTLNTVNTVIQSAIRKALAQGYVNGTRKANESLGCPHQNIGSVYAGNPQGPLFGPSGAFKAMQIQGCDPIFALENAREYLGADAEDCVQQMLAKLGWGDGTYPVETSEGGCGHKTVTPGAFVAANNQYALQSGFRQLENANDIGQIVGSLFSGMLSQVVSGSNGLIGLTQSAGGQASYLDRLTQESSTGLRNAAANAALQVILGAQSIERSYNQAMTAVATKLATTIGALRESENKCWNLIIENVCAEAPTGKKCTAKSGGELTIATSTQFSQPIIEDEIRTLANATSQNVTASNNALTLLNQLITGITNTSSLTAQNLALQQLDRLIAERRLHGQSDLQQAQQSQSAVVGSMDRLLQETRERWADAETMSEPDTGWCNINNQAVLEYWDQQWK